MVSLPNGKEEMLRLLIAAYQHDTANALMRAALRQHIAGDLLAYLRIGQKPVLGEIKIAASAYAADYGALLKDEGASIISGKKVPWLADSTAATRKTVFDTINAGIESGKPPGYKEGAGGTYPEGTVAYDLHTIFDERRSHASTVARTETGRIQNQSALSRYKERGYKVRVKDGDGAKPCKVCEAINGQIWDVDYAMAHELEHPNCVRDFVPVKDTEQEAPAPTPEPTDYDAPVKGLTQPGVAPKGQDSYRMRAPDFAYLEKEVKDIREATGIELQAKCIYDKHEGHPACYYGGDYPRLCLGTYGRMDSAAIEKESREQYEAGWWSSGGGIDRTIDHEIGHAVHDQVLNHDWYEKNYGKVHELFDEGADPSIRDFVGDNLSRYAAKDKYEFIAEYYAARMAGREFDDAFYERMDKHIIEAAGPDYYEVIEKIVAARSVQR